MTGKAAVAGFPTIDRRAFLGLVCALLASRPPAAAAKDGLASLDARLGQASDLPNWIRDPFLKRTLYRIRVNPLPETSGPAGANRDGFRWIEEQREGASWITRGVVNSQWNWIARGWRQLDWGLEHQDSDGGFTCEDAFHSTSFFVEALARSCIVYPQGATSKRLDALCAACDWMKRPEISAQGVQAVHLFAHRHFIIAAAFAQSAFLTRDQIFFSKARAYADAGIAGQWPDGTNPERGGFDVGYQMIGAIMALRYLAVLDQGPYREAVQNFIIATVKRELVQMREDGTIDTSKSTRVGIEIGRGGIVKGPPYEEIFESLIYGAVAFGQDEWRQMAEKLAESRNWIEG